MKDKRTQTTKEEIDLIKACFDRALESAYLGSGNATDGFIKLAKDRIARAEGMIVRISMGNLSNEDWEIYKEYPIQKENRQ
jgi:hypothetical protein